MKFYFRRLKDLNEESDIMTLKKIKKYIYYLSIFVFTGFIIISCKSSDNIKPQNAKEMYDLAMKKFQDEDWEDANQLFEVIKLQYAASQYADDAQYHIAEINFNKGQYILAAYNYNSLRRTYPTSPYFKEALFKAGLCYYKLSPPYDRDQEYTVKAIDVFQSYQHLYAGDSLSTEAGNFIDELRNKLGHRAFFTAKLYLKLHNPKAALIYLGIVIDEYPDTRYFEIAHYEKIKILSNSSGNEELNLAIKKYKTLFPKGKYIKEVEEIEKNNKRD